MNLTVLGLREKLLLFTCLMTLSFKIIHFLKMYPIVVGLVDNFGAMYEEIEIFCYI